MGAVRTGPRATDQSAARVWSEEKLGHGLLLAALSAAFKASEGRTSAPLQACCHLSSSQVSFRRADIHPHPFPGEKGRLEGEERT